jgi:DNA-binding transcriptional regulator YiaG
MREWTPKEIKRLKQTLKLSQKAFGNLLGVTRQYIYYLERGERLPNKTLKLLLDCVEERTKKTKKGKGVVK